jgi:hypothetical protein
MSEVLYAADEVDSNHSPHWVQDRPFVTCHCGKRRCCDPKCSFDGRKEWARRQAIVLNNHLLKCRRQGQMVYFGTCNFSGPVYPKDAAQIVAKFQKLLTSREWAVRWYMEASPADTTTVHIHFVLLTYEQIAKDTIQAMWRQARGESRQLDVDLQPARSCKAVAQYITGHDQGKYCAPLLDRGLGIRTCGGSRKFFPMSIDERYKEISRNYKAFMEFANDPDMCAMVQSGADLQAHYLAKIDEEYEQYLDHAFDRRPRLPVEDWFAIFAPAATGANTQDNSTAQEQEKNPETPPSTPPESRPAPAQGQCMSPLPEVCPLTWRGTAPPYAEGAQPPQAEHTFRDKPRDNQREAGPPPSSPAKAHRRPVEARSRPQEGQGRAA